MVALAPFRALRYNPQVVGDLTQVVAPPYDVISPDDQDRLYAASAYNIVRLILGKEHTEDTPASNRYSRARQTYEDWLARGVLVRDEAPALYVLEQTFTWQRRSFQRLGLLGLLDLSDRGMTQVFPHESTLQGPKLDRARLLEAVPAHLSPIFCLAPDAGGEIRGLLGRLRDEGPVAAASEDPLGNGQLGSARLFAVSDAGQIQQFQRLLEAVSLVIADGHHRFEVSVARRHQVGAILCCVACLEDPAVLIAPIHRTMRWPPEVHPMWRARLHELCEVQPVGGCRELQAWLERETRQGRYGLYAEGRYARVTMKEDVLAQWLLRPTVPFALSTLEVAILHGVLLPRLLEPHSEGEASLRYPAQLEDAVAMVERREADCAWVLRGIGPAQVFALASQGLRLPQKSTYFHPKVPTGLCLNPFSP